jgi:hypothetical protein
MPHAVTIQLYKFDELSDAAKEKARDWFREASANDDWYDFVYEDVDTVAALLGIEIDRKAVKLMGGSTRHDPAIWFSLGYVQGDFASFDGRYAYAKGGAAKVRAYAPMDEKLHRIADALQALQKANGYQLTASVRDTSRYGAEVEVERSNGGTVLEQTYQELRDLLRDFMQWIYDQLRAEDMYRNTDEQVDENIVANEYDFYEDGSRSRVI